MSVEERSAVLEAESAAFLLMSSILRKMPEHEWLCALAAEGVFDEVPYAQGNEFVRRGSDALCVWAAGYDESSFDQVYNDCMVLLIGPGKPLAAPWESVYSEKNEGLIFQQETLDVRRAYRDFDLQIDQLHREPDDHIAYELEFVARLCSRAADALIDGRNEEVGRLLEAKDSFMNDHLATWVFRWCDLMEEHASTDFYRGVAFLTRGFMQESLETAAA